MSNSHNHQEARNNRWQQHQREASRDNLNRIRSQQRVTPGYAAQNDENEMGVRKAEDHPHDEDSRPHSEGSDSRYDVRQIDESWTEPRFNARDSSNREWVTGTGQPPYPYREAQASRSESRQGSQHPSRATRSFAGRSPQGYQRSDERITEDVNEEMTRAHDLDATYITVETKNGEVTLKGLVMDRESKLRAEQIAENSSGVLDVQNRLRIRREEAMDSDVEQKSRRR